MSKCVGMLEAQAVRRLRLKTISDVGSAGTFGTRRSVGAFRLVGVFVVGRLSVSSTGFRE